MNKGLKEEVKTVVNSLLIPHSKGLTLDKFLKEYSDFEMKPFPHSQLGFNTPADFLFSVPDAVRCTTLKSGHILLQAVANENVSHIQQLVKGQKNNQSASLKNFNRLLQQGNHYCPPFIRNFPPPPIYTNQNISSQHSVGPRSLLGERPPSFSVPNHSKSRPQVAQTFSSSGAILPSSLTCSNVEYECQLVSEFHNIFQSHPDGVDTAHVFALYSNRYKKEVNFHQIEPNMTSVAFFKRHEHIFRLWERSESTLVGLVEPYAAQASNLSTKSRSSHTERGSLTGAIPKGQFSKNNAPPNLISTTPAVHLMSQSPIKAVPTDFQSPTKGVPPQFKSPTNIAGVPSEVAKRTAGESAFQPKWSALDIRTRYPVTTPLQKVTTMCNSEEQSAHVTPQKISHVCWQAQPRDDDVLPATFGVCRPKIKNVYQPDTKMTRQAFPPNLADFDYFFLIVAEVYSPGEFYWFLSENRKPIEHLTDDMTLFYGANPEYVISRKEMYIGQLVAAMYTDNLWYRARIVGCHEDMFQVFYVDYGSKNFITINRIRHLHMHFTTMPLQVFRGRIFGIQPLPTEKKWSFESGKWFLDLIKGCKIIAAAKMFEETLAIPEYEIDTVYSLTLVDTTKENDIHISDYLIDNGFAVACEEEQSALVAANPVEYSDPAPKLSPRPTCASPSSTTASILHQLENTSLSFQTTSPSVSHGQFDFSNPSIDDLIVYDTKPSKIQTSQIGDQSFVEQPPSVASVSPVPERSKQCCVSQLVLKDKRMLYVVEYDGDLYLPKPDMLMLVPSLDRHVAALKVKFEFKVVNIQTHPHIFSDCAKAGAPWMMDKQGEPVSQLILYSLQHVSLLLFLCSVKDKVASSALESKRQEYNSKIKRT